MTFTYENGDSYKKIQLLRNELIECGIKNGLCHPTTVKLSQSLDQLLNKQYINNNLQLTE